MIILFSSYARSQARKDSDIDVAVLVDHIEGDYLDKCTRLSQLTRKVNPFSLQKMNTGAVFWMKS